MRFCMSKARSTAPIPNCPQPRGRSPRWVLSVMVIALCATFVPTLQSQSPVATPGKQALELSIAAASDLKFVFDELVIAFEAENPGIKVKPVYGSSGNFFAMIRNKAPFDMFFSADVDYPQRLAASGFGADTNVFLYARGRIVLWVRSDSRIELELERFEALLDPSVRKIAIANPRHAPYGRAAVAAMEFIGVYDQARSKLVFGENVTQALQFTQSGAADVGIIALSLAESPQMQEQGRYWEVPLGAYPKIEQGGLILKWSTNLAAASQFRDFVLGDAGRAVMERYGFILPD
jgi:molybdate transport system substrate-binding protein